MQPYLGADILKTVKTTVEISDALFHEVCRLAAREGVTLRSLVEPGLHHILSEEKHRAPFKLRRASFKGKGLQLEFRHTSWEHVRDLVYGNQDA